MCVFCLLCVCVSASSNPCCSHLPASPSCAWGNVPGWALQYHSQSSVLHPYSSLLHFVSLPPGLHQSRPGSATPYQQNLKGNRKNTSIRASQQRTGRHQIICHKWPSENTGVYVEVGYYLMYFVSPQKLSERKKSSLGVIRSLPAGISFSVCWRATQAFMYSFNLNPALDTPWDDVTGIRNASEQKCSSVSHKKNVSWCLFKFLCSACEWKRFHCRSQCVYVKLSTLWTDWQSWYSMSFYLITIQCN